MTGRQALPFDIAPILNRFPRDATLIARLLVESETFRHICEDYALARATLARLEGLQQSTEPVEAAEYRSLVSELEKEIVEALRNAKHSH